MSEPKKKEGVLLITSNSLCFDDKMEGPKGESIVIKLREITELKKSKVKLVFDALLLSTHDSVIKKFLGIFSYFLKEMDLL